MGELQIDSEFQALIPPLSDEERGTLESNVKAEGCRDPIVTWQGVILDGHNRYEICTRLGISFKVEQMEFENRAEARVWMRNNQRGRRNLSDAWKIELELANKEDLAKIGRAVRASTLKQNASHDPASVLSETDKTDNAETAEKHNTQNQIAKDAGVSTGKVGQAEVVRKKDPELWEKAKQGDVTINAAHTQVKRREKEENRESRRQQNRTKVSAVQAPEQIAQSGARFSTIAIDPPWDWSDEGDQDQLGRARPDYSTMTIDQLMKLPVSELADDDCHLYLWVTNRSLPKGFTLLDRWGFRYITAITWVKPHFGMGNYFRGQSEHILFGVKGSQPLKRKNVSTVFHASRGDGGHSSKPSEFYDLVESCSPGPYLEMFSRSDRADWVCWGEDDYAAA